MRRPIPVLAMLCTLLALLAACRGADKDTALAGYTYNPASGEQGSKLENVAMQQKDGALTLSFRVEGEDYEIGYAPDDTIDEGLGEEAETYSAQFSRDGSDCYSMLIRVPEGYSGLVRDLDAQPDGTLFGFVLLPDEQALSELLGQLQQLATAS